MNKPTTTTPTHRYLSPRVLSPHVLSPHVVLPLAALLLAGQLALTGCSSVPPPKAEMAVARTAVNNAVSAGGTENAPVEMRSAQDKLSGAEKAMTAEEYETARYLAEEAAVDAQLAERKSRAVKTQSAVDDAKKGIEVLRQEMQRGGANPSGSPR